MLRNAFYTSVAAIVLSATLVQTAAAIAYPATATTSRTTVTGVYNPLNLDLTLSNGVDALDYDSVNDSLSFQADYSGTFQGVGYQEPVGGTAGTWQLLLSSIFAGTTVYQDGDIFLSSNDAGVQVGTLTYLGGLAVTFGSLLPADTPATGDVFKIYSTTNGNVFGVDCGDQKGVDSGCHEFNLALGQTLRLDGPFQNGNLVDERQCDPQRDFTCGGFTLTETSGTEGNSVPEPATLALLGMGLAGLGLFRRPRQA